jgi:hypothetical protein
MVSYTDVTVNGTVMGGTDTQKNWKVISSVLTCDGRIYIPEPFHSNVIDLFLDSPKSGHIGALRTAQLEFADLYWPAINVALRQYVAACIVCHQIKAPSYLRYKTNMPLPPPDQPWDRVTMAFVKDLPKPTALAYTRSLVIVDQITKMAIYLPCWNDIHSPELAQVLFEQVIWKHPIQANTITDCSTQYSSRFCNRVSSDMSINHLLLTAIQPQTDCQTKHKIRTKE